MAFLGEFNAALRELDPVAENDKFSFFGETFEVVAEFPPMLSLQIGALMTGKLEDVEGAGATWAALEASLGEEGFGRFYRLAIAKRASLETLMEVVMAIFQRETGRPTVQVPDSPSGQSSTSLSSSTSASTPPASGVVEMNDDRDPSVPHLVPVSRVLAG